MPDYSASGVFDATGTLTDSYRLSITARTSEVTGGTLVQIFAEVTKFRTHGSVATTGGGTRSWSLPGGRSGSTSGSSDSSGSSSWSYNFPAASTNTVNVYNFFNRYIPYSYGNSTTLSVTAAGSGSSFLTSRTVSVNVPLFTAPVAPAPTAPTSLSASTTRTDGISLSWSGASGSITNYGIWWNSTATGAPSSGSTPDFTTTSTSFLDTNPPQGLARYYWVRAQGEGGNSAWFPSGNGVFGLRAEPTPPPPAPPTPTNFSSGNITTTSIPTSWTASSGASGYELFLNGSFVASTTSTSYNFSSLVSNTSYTLGVRAFASNAGGTSASSTTTIVRSTLPVTFTVPSVFGQSRSVAINTLQTAGFGSVTVTDVTTGATLSNNLLTFSQSPSSGTTAIAGSAATIDVYDFRTAVPNIVGQTETQALTTLTSSGFNSRSSSLTTSGATVSNNLKVGTQSPTAGTQTNPANSVTFTIFNFLTAVPNVVGQTLDNAITTLGNLGFLTVSTTLDEAGATEENVGKVKSQTPVNSATTFNPANTSVNLTIFSLGVTGKRFTGTGFVALSNAKRFDGSVWQPITVAKRFNGTTWLDISN